MMERAVLIGALGFGIGAASPWAYDKPLYWLITMPMAFACGFIVQRLGNK